MTNDRTLQIMQVMFFSIAMGATVGILLGLTVLCVMDWWRNK